MPKSLLPTDPDDRARLIGKMAWMIDDALSAAQSAAQRASEACEGDPAVLLFERLREAIQDFRHEGAAMKAIRSAAIPPSYLTGGKP